VLERCIRIIYTATIRVVHKWVSLRCNDDPRVDINGCQSS